MRKNKAFFLWVGTGILIIPFFVLALNGCASHKNRKIHSLDSPVFVPRKILTPVPESLSENRQWVLFNNDGIENGAKAALYAENGGVTTIGTLVKPKSVHSFVRFSKKMEPGVYRVIVTNPNGSHSRMLPFMIPADGQMSPITLVFEPVRHCAGRFSENPKNIFLGGGMATSLFDGYLNLEGNSPEMISGDIKIVYFKLEKGQLERKEIQAEVLRAALMEHEQLLSYLKKQLSDQKAEFIPDIEAHSDYYQCIGP